MLDKSFLFLIPMIVIVGCGRRDYGVFMPIGALIETDSVSLEVPLERLRVSINNPQRGDVVMYEDYGPGLSRGMVFLVQTRVGELRSAAISELKLFGGPEKDWLDEAQLVDDPDTPRLDGIHYRLRIPPIERPLGSNGRIVERQAIYMMGNLHEDRGSICRIQVAWNPDAEEGPGVADLIERQLQQAQDALRRLEASVRRCHSALTGRGHGQLKSGDIVNTSSRQMNHPTPVSILPWIASSKTMRQMQSSISSLD